MPKQGETPKLYSYIITFFLTNSSAFYSLVTGM